MNEHLLAADRLFSGYDKQTILHDISISVPQNKISVILGANGCGKSTLLKTFARLLKPSKGTITLDGKHISSLPSRQLAQTLGLLPQTPVTPEGIKVTDLVSRGRFPYRRTFSGLSSDDFSAVSDALEMMGITNLADRSVDELSGGQRQRVWIALALAQQTDILLLDEPTNHLDLDAISWLEEFLINFENTVIVVSHDRYFLNKVCTHTADIDYGKIQLYAGNYDFWYESSQLMIKQMKEANKKKEEKIKELQEFIQRFSANASKSKQATSRKRALEKIELDEIKPSSRKYPYIDFRPEREIGNEVLSVENLSKTIDGVKVLDNISFILGREDKVAFVGPNEQAKTVLFKILSGEMEPDEGSYKWGLTTSAAFIPRTIRKSSITTTRS